MTSTLSRWREVAAVATTAPLRQYLAGRVFATTSAWVFRVTAGWAVWELTRSPALLGVTTFLMLAPSMVLAPWAGVLADRWDKRRLMFWAHLLSALLKSAVALLAFAGLLSVGTLLPMIVAVGCAGALTQAAAKTIVSALVEEDDLATAISLNSVIFNVSGFIGPALAGVAVATAGVSAGFALAAASTALFLLSLRALPALPGESGREASIAEQLAEGLRYTFGDPLLKLLLALHLASATLARPFLDFVPALVATLFGGGTSQSASIVSASGLGAVVGGLWLAQRRGTASLLPVVLGAMVLLGVLLIALAWNPWFPLAVVLAFLAGGCMIARAAAIQTMIQMHAAPELRGRAVSFYGLILNAGSILGALAIGFLAELLGISIALTLSVSAALVAWALLRQPLTQAATHAR